MTSGPLREAVGVLQDESALRAAVDELLISGFDRSDISVVAGRRSVERKLGAMYDDVTDLEDEPDAPVTVYVGCDSRTEAKAVVVGGLVYVGAVGAIGTVVTSGGTLAAAFTAAAIAGGVGGLIGGVISKFLDRHHAEYVDQQLTRGGLLLWVHTADRDHEVRACQILKRQSARDVHVHDIVHAKPNVVSGVSHDLSFMNKIEGNAHKKADSLEIIPVALGRKGA